MKKKLLVLPLVISFVGTAIFIFMKSLNGVVGLFQSHWYLLLPGLILISLVYGYLEHFREVHRFGDTDTLYREIRDPQKPVHWMLAPWIFIWTLLFHLFGASVGRESTAIQIGGSLSESLGRLMRIPTEHRPLLIRLGLAAGFGAAFGTPWAGFIFALEKPFWLKKRRDVLDLPLLALASYGADRWARLLGLDHAIWKSLDLGLWDFASLPYFQMIVFFIALACGYDLLFRKTFRFLSQVPWWIRSSIASVAVFVLTFLVGGPTYNNLGENLILKAFREPANGLDSIGKLGFTFLSTVGAMKGGEVTPLMASGALFGSWICGRISLMTFQFGAAMGLVSLFSSRLRCPLTGMVMLWEFFGWQTALLASPILLLTEFAQRWLVSKSS